MGNSQLVQLVETSFSGAGSLGKLQEHLRQSSKRFPGTLPASKDGSDPLSSVAQSCLTLCNPMNRRTPGLPVHHKLPEFSQTRLGDAIQQIPGQALNGGPQAPSALLPAPTQSHWPSCLQPPLFQHVVALQKLYFSEVSYRTLKFFKEIKLARLKTTTSLIYSQLKYQQAF